MSFEDPGLLNEFVVESQEHLANIETQLLTMESQGESLDSGLVNTVFRAIHSIKGAAGFLGLDVLGGLAHRTEEVLDGLRNSEIKSTSSVINTLLRSTDRLKDLIDNIETSNDQDVDSYLHELGQILSEKSELAETESESNAPKSNEVARGSQESEPKLGLNSISSNTIREFLIESFDNLEQMEKGLLSIDGNDVPDETINGVFRCAHSVKGTGGFLGFAQIEKLGHAMENLLGAIRSGTRSCSREIIDALLKSIDELRAMLLSIESKGVDSVSDISELTRELDQLLTGTSPTTAVQRKTDGAASIGKPAPVPIRSQAEATKPSQAKPAAADNSQLPNEQKAKALASEVSAADSTLRVDVGLLDGLMTRVGELVLARNQLLQCNSQLRDPHLQRVTQRINLIVSELQEGVMKTRMQPIGTVWSKFPRLVRDLASTCKKEVRVEMIGKETELDKAIVEAIKDPLTHLVRNTVDHGIEKPEVRSAAGKPTEGCLTLQAYHEGGQVNIAIIDDGGGLNVERIKSKALEKGLISTEVAARMSDRDAGNLIFLPGFSTAEQVSSISGRGVGMDVVKTNIEKLGGTVDLFSQQGLGTTIKIRIPLTLAIIPALVVTCQGNRYAIPQVSLQELLLLEGEKAKKAIEWVHGAPVYRLRGKLLPLVSLRQQLGGESTLNPNESHFNIVVLRVDDRSFGLVVDKVNDAQEIVVKPLNAQLQGVPIYSGSTIMGDGRVSLILDIPSLAQSSNVLSDMAESSLKSAGDGTNEANEKMKTLLVFSSGEGSRSAFPLDQIDRLERIDVSKLERANGANVVQYSGGILPLVNFSELNGYEYTPRDPNEWDVVVVSHQGKKIGLVVDRLVDIVEIDMNRISQSNSSSTQATAVIGSQVTSIIDVHQWVESIQSQIKL